MGKPAARLGDQTTHGSPLLGSPCTTVLIGGQPAWRMGDQHTCPIPNAPPPAGPGTPHGPGNTMVIPDSASMVLVGGKAAARLGDMVTEPGAVVPLPPPNPIAAGCPTVLIATMPGGGDGSGDKDSYCAGDPVSIFDGTVFDVVTDFEIQNFVPIWITRAYRSTRSRTDGAFGYGWSHNLACSITPTGSKLAFLEGHAERLIDASSNGSPAINGAAGCAAIATGRGYLVFSKDVDNLYHFDIPGPNGQYLVSRIEDFYGNGLSFSYDADGRIAMVSDRANRRLILDYTDRHVSSLRVSAPSASARLVKQYRYDRNNDLVEVQDVSGHSVRLEYDDHLMVSKTLPSGYRILWQYDAERRCTKTWTSDSRYSYAFEFLPDFHTLVTAANGQREIVQFEENGALVGSVDQLGPLPPAQKSVPILIGGRVTSLIDDDGRMLKPEYDEAGRVAALHLASGGSWRKVYDRRGTEQAITSPENRSAKYEYDDRDRQTRIENPDGSWEEWAWDDADNIVSVKLSSGIEWRFDHDAFGNITAQTGPSGKATTYRLDEQFRIAEEYRPDGSWLKWRFNELGSASDIESSTGYRTVFTRNGIGQITGVTTFGPGGAPASETAFDLDLVGMVRAVRSAEGEMAVRRDVRSRITELTRWDGSRITCEYDAADRLRRATLPSGDQVFGYDDAGFVASVKYSDGSEIAVERDPAGRVKSLQDEKSGRKLAVVRDGEGNVIGDRSEGGDVAYPLTAGHKVASIAVDGEDFAHFQWDSAGLRSVSAFGQSIQLRYDVDRYRSEIVFPGGVTQRRSFSPSGRLLSERTVSGDGTPLLDFAYGYDSAGRLSSIDRGERKAFRYDAAGRLTRVDAEDTTETYTFDAAGNLSRDESLVYDVSGRLSERGSPKGTIRYSYDPQDRLRCVMLQDGRTVEYKYDLIGRRTEKRTDAELVRFTWAGPTMVRESHYDTAGETLRREIRYTWFAGCRLPAIRQDIDYESGRVAATHVYFYHLDRRGVPRALTDESGKVVWSGDFDAWSGIRASQGEIEQPFRLEGHYLDSETGLHYTIERYYDPLLGRFLTPSLHDEIAGYGAAVYCYGDPVNYVDPTGNDPVEGGVLWIQGELKSAFESAVESGAGKGLEGSELGKYVDGKMSNSIEDINKELQGMDSEHRVIDQAQRFEEFDPKNPKAGWGRGTPPYPKSKIADAIIVKVACDFKKATPTYKDGQKGAIKKICRGYDWSVGQPENLADDQAKYAELFTEGSTTRFQMWDANNSSVASMLKGAGVI